MLSLSLLLYDVTTCLFFSPSQEFLKATGVVFTKKTTKHKNSMWRYESYTKGKADSKEIDINQRSIDLKPLENA